MARAYRGGASWQTQRLASHNPSGILLGAGAARAAAELGRKHKGNIPPEAIEDVARRFSTWLQAACNAASTPAPAVEDAC